MKLFCLSRLSISTQQGFATLVIVLLLLLTLTTLTLSLSRSSKLEQLITGNELHSQEVQNAAEAALNYAITWASDNPLPWSTPTAIQIDCINASTCPKLPTTLTTGEGDTFEFKISFQRTTNKASFIKVSVTANQANNNASSTVTCYIDSHGVMIPGTWKDF